MGTNCSVFLCNHIMSGIHRLGQRAPIKSKPICNPITEPDLLKLVDTMIFLEQLAKLTPQELKEARETKMYQMLARMGREAYRAGEQGLRPKPALMVLRDQPEEADEQADITPKDITPAPVNEVDHTPNNPGDL